MEATFTNSIFLPLYWLKSRGAPEISVREISYKDAVVFWAVAIVHVSSKHKNILENILYFNDIDNNRIALDIKFSLVSNPNLSESVQITVNN